MMSGPMRTTQISTSTAPSGPLLPDLLPLTGRALDAAEGLLAAAKRRLLADLAPGGTIDPALVEARQFAAPGYGWVATYVQARRQTRLRAERPWLGRGAR